MISRRFTTFQGVFTPCLLSILGVIMFLRLGWVVGHVGLAGTLVIICLSNSITLLTALSMSSVVTNIRIGAGGAYSIITKSLGLQAGGAIGIPLYLSQAISVAFYITGFAECWQFVFPSHSILVISLFAWFLLLGISYMSTKLAFQIQYVVMALIGVGIISILLGRPEANGDFSFFAGFEGENFWRTFAIFFPAVTGILAGASMSGELKEPKRSIPLGTLWAIALGFILYCLLAFQFAKNASLADLQTNNAIALDLGKWRGCVIVGIMGATISSALTMFVGAPRILMALGKNSILPFSSLFTFVNKKGEPTNAILFTAVISFFTIIFGSLDKIATLLTMFFLITYGMINLTVFLEQSIGIASFRPSFKVAKIVPLLGAIGCLGIMLLIDLNFSIIAFCVIIAMYYLLSKKEIAGYSPDIRSGMLVFLAEKFARAARSLPYYPKIWKPNLLIPIYPQTDVLKIIPYIRDMASPSGRVTVIKILTPKQMETYAFLPVGDSCEKEIGQSLKEKIHTELKDLLLPLKEEGLFFETAVVEVPSTLEGTKTIMQTLTKMFFPPNALFYSLNDNEGDYTESHQIVQSASDMGLGIVVFKHKKQSERNQQRSLNLWIRRKSPNLNLAILTAIQFEKSWNAKVRILQVVEEESGKREAIDYLLKLKGLMRLSESVEVHALVGKFYDVLACSAPMADINVFGMQEQVDLQVVNKVFGLVKTPILFLRDSKNESALA